MGRRPNHTIPATSPALKALEMTDRLYRKSAEKAESLRTDRDEAVRLALDVGHTHTQIARVTGLSRGRINQIARALAVVLALILVVPMVARATTLINDPAHPYSPQAWSRLVNTVASSKVPTDPGTVIFSNAQCSETALACTAGRVWDGATFRDDWSHTWLLAEDTRNPDVIYHELGRSFAFHVLLPADETALDAQFHVTHWDGVGPNAGTNKHADAYAKCAESRNWPGRWWSHGIIHRRHGRVIGGSTLGDDTSYVFRAGPRRFKAICGIYRQAAAHGSHGYDPYAIP